MSGPTRPTLCRPVGVPCGRLSGSPLCSPYPGWGWLRGEAVFSGMLDLAFEALAADTGVNLPPHPADSGLASGPLLQSCANPLHMPPPPPHCLCLVWKGRGDTGGQLGGPALTKERHPAAS